VNRAIKRLWGLPWLAVWATGAIAAASAQVARDIVKPSEKLVPGIVIVPLRMRTQTEVAVWMSLVNLTPGTLVVEISDDLDEAWVHSLYAGDPAALKQDLNDLQDRVNRSFGDEPIREVR
jgi:multicomponent Na+:H+ antiporter subunit E